MVTPFPLLRPQYYFDSLLSPPLTDLCLCCDSLFPSNEVQAIDWLSDIKETGSSYVECVIN